MITKTNTIRPVKRWTLTDSNSKQTPEKCGSTCLRTPWLHGHSCHRKQVLEPSQNTETLTGFTLQSIGIKLTITKHLFHWQSLFPQNDVLMSDMPGECRLPIEGSYVAVGCRDCVELMQKVLVFVICCINQVNQQSCGLPILQHS